MNMISCVCLKFFFIRLGLHIQPFIISITSWHLSHKVIHCEGISQNRTLRTLILCVWLVPGIMMQLHIAHCMHGSFFICIPALCICKPALLWDWAFEGEKKSWENKGAPSILQLQKILKNLQISSEPFWQPAAAVQSFLIKVWLLWGAFFERNCETR